MKKYILLILVFCIPFVASAQEKDDNKLKLKLTGFVKNDFFWDSRQTVAAREGHFLLWPQAIDNDLDGNDINAKSNFNFLAVQSRISLGIIGTEAFGAKISGKIEGDFFAQANDNINLLRLRHAFVKMNWTNTELLFGQYWIPMFITGCFPGTVSFNTGVPMQPFGRNPQIRFTQKFGGLKIIAVASSQRDYASRFIKDGKITPSGEFMRNSMLPELSAQIHFAKDKTILAGIGASYKQIVPQIKTEVGVDSFYVTDATVSSISAIAFLKVKTSPVTIKMEGVYGQNTPDVLGIGGFAVTEITDVARGSQSYSPISTMSAWTDIHTNGKDMQFGVFGGYTKNLGTDKDVVGGAIYGLGTTIESLYRVSPRMIFNSGNVRFALEGEYTVANFGTTKDARAIPTDITTAANFRMLAAVYYFFK